MILLKSDKIRLILYLQLVIISLAACHSAYTPVRITANNQPVRITKDSNYSLTESYLAPYRQQLIDSFSLIIATTTDKLLKEQPCGSLGNMITTAIWQDVKYNSVGTSQAPSPLFVLMNYGGIRLKEIATGNITMGTIFELLPFENTLVSIEITGADLIILLEQLNKTGGWPMRFNTKKFKSLQDINVRQRYELITNNYIAKGGDNCSLLKTLPQKDTGILLRDIVINYLKKKKSIKADCNTYILN